MLTKKEAMDRYGEIRKFTAQYSGLGVILIEDYLKDIVKSHNEAIELLEAKELLDK